MSSRCFGYGAWSPADGLARVPIHPSLYQEHVEQAAQDLIVHLSASDRLLPFPLQDNIELWLMDATGKQPVALIASQLPEQDFPPQQALRWYPTPNAETTFASDACAVDQTRDPPVVPTQDYLLRIIHQRCQQPFQALWIERLADGSGCILQNHSGKTGRRHTILAAEAFPECLLSEDWHDPQARQLVTDYLNWQAPLLLMLPLSLPRRRELEQQAQYRPLSVHTCHRLYPEILDQELLNKILVEAVMRKAATKS